MIIRLIGSRCEIHFYYENSSQQKQTVPPYQNSEALHDQKSDRETGKQDALPETQCYVDERGLFIDSSFPEP